MPLRQMRSLTTSLVVVIIAGLVLQSPAIGTTGFCCNFASSPYLEAGDYSTTYPPWAPHLACGITIGLS